MDISGTKLASSLAHLHLLNASVASHMVLCKSDYYYHHYYYAYH